MKISEYSRARFYKTFSTWDVPGDFADPIYNYLVFGYSPGSCFTAVLANDFARAIGSSHPSNTVTAFKSLVGWINDHLPSNAGGSYEAVQFWQGLTAEARRSILERQGLIYTAPEETWLAVKGEPVEDTALYGL
jgi:hypothetical protein